MRTVLAVLVVLTASFAGSSRLPTAPADSQAPLMIPPEIVAAAQETRMGGQFVLEVDAKGKVIGYSGDVELDKVPAICREAVDKAAPGGKAVNAEKETIGASTYWEVEKEIGGLKMEFLVAADGKIVGSEKQLAEKDIPAEVLKAANGLMPEGELVAVERVEGPETLGAVEHHVKKKIKGEVIRIRVTDKGAVEELRKLPCELKVPLKK
jgi:hypothetical protein